LQHFESVNAFSRRADDSSIGLAAGSTLARRKGHAFPGPMRTSTCRGFKPPVRAHHPDGYVEAPSNAPGWEEVGATSA
jgi:hypothetical protein